MVARLAACLSTVVLGQDIFLAQRAQGCGPEMEVASRTVSNQGKFAVWVKDMEALLWVDSPAFTPAWTGSVVYAYKPSEDKTYEVTRFDTATVGAILPRAAGGVVLAMSRPQGDGVFASTFETMDIDPSSMQGGNLQAIASLPAETKGKFNNGRCDSAGRLWAGTFDYGKEQEQGAKVWTLQRSADGNGHAVNVAIDGLSHPNGYIFSKDGQRLLLSETYRNVVYEYDLSADGSIAGAPKTLVQGRNGEVLIDSICGLADGSFFATNPDPIGKLVHYSAEGSPLCETTVDVPNSHFVASCEFIGEDMYVPSGRNGGSDSGPDGWLYRFKGMGQGLEMPLCDI
jgi:sugar lactone lactonase YvrE